MSTKAVRMRSLTLSVILAVLTTGVGNAQESGDQGLDLEEIIVIAQKREQSLQEVPISLEVLDGQLIEDSVIQNGFELIKYLPGFQIDDSPEIRTTTLKTRGIGTLTNSIGLQSSNLIVVDGEVLPRQSMANLSVNDLERVEALRGPQGTLFGQNTSTGMIHYVTKRPSLSEAGGHVRFQVSDYQGFDTRAALNLPLGDNWALRVNGLWSTIDGYIINTNPDAAAEDIGAEEQSGGRAQLLYDGGSGLSVLLRAEYAETETNCCARVAIGDINPDGIPVLLLDDGAAAIVGSNGLFPPPNFDTFNAPAASVNSSQFGSTENTGFSAEVNYALTDSIDLTYIGSYRDFQLLNSTGGPNSQLAISRSQWGGDETVDVLQQELRFSSYANERFSWTAGLFYHKTDGARSEVNDRCTGGGQATARPVVQDGVIIACASRASTEAVVAEFDTSGIVDTSLLVPDRRLDQGNFTTNFENTAVFAQVEFKLSDSFDFLLGGRAFREESDATFQSIRVALPPGSTGLETFEQGLAWAEADPTLFRRFNEVESFDDSVSDFIYKAVLGYNASDSVRLYLNYSTGYKGPSYFITGNTDPADADQFPTRPENSQNIELGFRNVFLDGKLLFNATLFDMTVEDYQIRAAREIDPLQGLFFAGYVNAEEARSKGVELDVHYRPTDQFSLYASLASFDATFEKFSNVPINCPGGILADRCEVIGGRNRFDSSGLPFANNSETQFRLSSTYEWPIAGGNANVYVRGDFRYEGDRTRSVAQIAQERPPSPDYSVTDLYIGAEGERLSAQIFVKNVFDDAYSTRFEVNSLGFGSAFYPRDYSRFVGASVRVDF